MDAILKFDTGLFLTINGALTSPFLDALMPFITEKSNFIVVILAVVAVMVARGRKKDLRTLILLIVVVLISDLLSTTFKNIFLRVRPCHAIEGVRLLVGCGGSYSFPSGHATNIFAAMVFLSARYRRLLPFFLVVAASVAYSRVYVGVHYPIDVAAGAVLGTVVALIFAEADRKWVTAIINNLKKQKKLA